MIRPRSDKLDLILNGLLYINKEELAGKKIEKVLSIEFLSESMGLNVTDWEAKSLENELLHDGYVIKTDDNQVRITQRGIKFITNEKGYGYLDKRSNQEDAIREKTIEKFRYDKISFWISILAIIISIISLWISK
jgi:predicted transcriptional regulator